MRNVTGSSDIIHCISRYFPKSLFKAHQNIFWSNFFIELLPELHGTIRRNYEHLLRFQCNSVEPGQHKLNFHEISVNYIQIQGWMEYHFLYSRVPWNTTGLLIFPKVVPSNSMEPFQRYMEFHETWSKLDMLKNHISKYCLWYLTNAIWQNSAKNTINKLHCFGNIDIYSNVFLIEIWCVVLD